jgi:hypothetical protein
LIVVVVVVVVVVVGLVAPRLGREHNAYLQFQKTIPAYATLSDVG